MNTSLDPRKNPMGFAFGLVGAMFVCVVIFMYMLFIKPPFLTYENLPFPPVLESVAPGEIMPIRVVRCNSDRVPHTYMTTRTLERMDRDHHDVKFITLQPSLASISPGCTDEISLQNKLPDHVPPGMYRLIGTAEVRTLIRTDIVEWSSQNFYVVRKRQEK